MLKFVDIAVVPVWAPATGITAVVARLYSYADVHFVVVQDGTAVGTGWFRFKVAHILTLLFYPDEFALLLTAVGYELSPDSIEKLFTLTSTSTSRGRRRSSR
jgi:hypothetical protein